MRTRLIVEGAGTRLEGPLLFLKRTIEVGLNDAVEVIGSDGRPRLGRVATLDEQYMVVEVLETTAGLSLAQTRVRFFGHPLHFDVGPGILGRVVNGVGVVLDGGPPVAAVKSLRIEGLPMTPVERDTPRDFIEFPSQFMEHYAAQPEVLAVYAKHAETGEVIPQQLVDKIIAAGTHNQGFKTTEYIAASLLDMNWHTLAPNEAASVEDPTGFEDQAMAAIGKPDEIESRYRSPYFSHIFAGGYSAGYYAYLWSEILDADGFTAFKQSGNIFDPELAARLKANVYQAGGSRDADVLYRSFRGQDPSIEPLLEIRGLN